MRAARIAFVIGVTVVGCSSSESSDSRPDGGIDANAPKDGGIDAPGDGAIPSVPFSVVDEPDAPCRAFVGSSGIIAPQLAALGSLGKAGSRRFAADALGEGVVVFDTDGKNAAPKIAVGALSVAAGGADLLLLGTSTTGVTTRRFAANGQPIADEQPLAPDVANAVVLARSGTKALAVWSTFDRVKARSLDAEGKPNGDAFDLETPSPKSQFHGAAAGDGQGAFLVAWSDIGGLDSKTRLFTARVRDGKLLGLVHPIVREFAALRVVSLLRVEAGYALLLSMADVPVVVPLDDIGLPRAVGRRLLGASATFGIARNGATLAVLATREHQTAVRPLDLQAKATAPWTCLTPARGGEAPSGGIDDDPAGFAATARGNDGEALLLRFAAPTP